MHRSGQSDWAHLPGDIGRYIWFKKLQQHLQAALDAQPKLAVDLGSSEIYVEFVIRDEPEDPETIAFVEKCVLSHDWKLDTYRWFDNASGYSIFRHTSGENYRWDHMHPKRVSLHVVS